MSISVKTRKLLWGKAANRCSFENCRKELVVDEIETDDPSIIGEECHIVGKEMGGPRGETELSSENRDLYDNLILLCRNHHKQIDDQPTHYSVDTLQDIKSEHENWVRNSLDIDESKMRNELIYSNYVDEWEKRCDLANWENWTSWLLGSGQPRMDKKKFEELEDLQRWLFNRIMPGEYLELEFSFENFRKVLTALLNTFTEHREEIGGELYTTEKFYKLDRWDPETYHRLRAEFEFHVDLVMDLTLELTRAANYICENVRRFLMKDYRFEEGLIMVTSGPYMDLNYKTDIVKYNQYQSEDVLFGDLEQFKNERRNRDMFFGEI